MNRLGVIAQATALAILTAGAGWWFVGVFVSGSVALPLVLMVVTVTATLVGIHLIRVPSLLVDLLVGTVCVLQSCSWWRWSDRPSRPSTSRGPGEDGLALTTELPLLAGWTFCRPLSSSPGDRGGCCRTSAAGRGLPMAPLLVIVARAGIR